MKMINFERNQENRTNQQFLTARKLRSCLPSLKAQNDRNVNSIVVQSILYAGCKAGNVICFYDGGCDLNDSCGSGSHHSLPKVAAGVKSSVQILWKVNLIRLKRCVLNQVIFPELMN